MTQIGGDAKILDWDFRISEVYKKGSRYQGCRIDRRVRHDQERPEALQARERHAEQGHGRPEGPAGRGRKVPRPVPQGLQGRPGVQPEELRFVRLLVSENLFKTF